MSSQTKVEHPPFFKSVRNYFREYCNCTSIHGFKYFGEKRTYFERIWWCLVFTLTFAACILSIYEVYKKWLRNPVIVNFANKETPTYSIPFPAVTICPEIKSTQSLYSHMTVVQKFAKQAPLTERERKIVDYMGLICEENNYVKYSNTTYFTNDFYTTLEEINNGTMKFLSCEYMDAKYKEDRCFELFKPILTDEGICYSFNMMDKTEIFTENSWHQQKYFRADSLVFQNWTMKDGYAETAGLHTYPKRALLSGATNALSVTLNMSRLNRDLICKKALQGYRVTLHLPSRIPRPSLEYFRIPLDEIVVAAIQPQMTTTDPAIEIYPPHKRECFFPNEKKLKYFKLYTGGNCQLECLTNFTLYECGCVNFFMPRENTTKICGIRNLRCMKRAQWRYQLGDLAKLVNTSKSQSFSSKMFKQILKKSPNCNCMPMCSDLTYNVETSQSKWDWMEAMRAERQSSFPLFYFRREDYYVSKLIIFFKSSQFITSQRHELYGPTDFLANFGGLLGLFTGFSVLSLMEAIYFLTVRLCCNVRLYGYWAGPGK